MKKIERLQVVSRLTDLEIAWIAGLVEGEGCFIISGAGNGTPTIRVAMTDEDVVDKLRHMWGYTNNTQVTAAKLSTYRNQKLGFKKTVHSAYIYGEPALVVMQRILPHMGLRRRAKIEEILVRFKYGTAPQGGARVKAGSWMTALMNHKTG